jgi:hypothetical protein
MSGFPGPAGVVALDAAPVRVGLERRWQVRLADGRPGLLAQLLPELARDEALRRRYVQDLERLRALEAPVMAEILAIGPQPDPRDPGAAPPWRLRVDPPGETLEARLSSGPLPVDEALGIGRALASALHEVHRRGATLRDLHPRHIVLLPPRLLFTDVGLARVDVLSTRTAASVVLEGSPYNAPEQLRSGAVDARADLYSWGVIVWRALTGTFPFGDGPAILRAETVLPAVHEQRAGVPPGLSPLLARCLARDPNARPRSARELLDLLGGDPGAGALAVPQVVLCQACEQPLRRGLRLCPACGHAAVQFTHVARGDRDGYVVDLMTAREDDLFLRRLRGFLEAVGDRPLLSLNFLVGNKSFYSKEELPLMLRTPTRLIDRVSKESAEEIVARLRAQDIHVEARSHRELDLRERNATIAILSGLAVTVGSAALMTISPLGALGLGLGVLAAIVGTVSWLTRRAHRSGPLTRLRAAPVALPASDALVARLCAQLPAASPDVREMVAELAGLVQRLVDHRAQRTNGQEELAILTGPVAPLVDLVCSTIDSLAALDAELRGLDEGTLVRALAASEARGELRVRRLELLEGLERLRVLEEQRGRHLSGLLEAISLLERALRLALHAADADATYEREIHLALASLE